MQNIGKVSTGRRGWKIPAVEATESGELICYAASRNYPPIFYEELKRRRRRNTIHIIRQDNATKGH